jgi:hypothetical protein
MEAAALKVEQWPIERLIEYARNPRKNDSEVDKMASAIKEFGFRIPIVAKSDGEIVDGHLRLEAARKLGFSEVPVALADGLTDAQIKAFRLIRRWAGISARSAVAMRKRRSQLGRPAYWFGLRSVGCLIRCPARLFSAVLN